MKTLWRWVKFLLIKEPNPIKDQSYVLELGWFHQDVDDAVEQRDWNRLLQYGCVLLPITITIALYVFVYGPDQNEFDSIMRMDVFQWAHSDRLIYAVSGAHLLLAIYFFNLIYIWSKAKHYKDTFINLIVKEESISYHWPHHYKRQDCSTLIRKIFRHLFRCLQIIIISLDVELLLALAYYYNTVCTHWKYFISNSFHLWQIILSHMLWLNSALCYLIMFHSFIIVATLGIVEMFIWHIQLWQIDFAINSYNAHNRPRINRIMSDYRRFLVYIRNMNPLAGKSFVAFLLVSFPTNGCMLKMINSEGTGPILRFSLMLGCLYQYICIFGIHFLFAKRNSQLRGLSKQIMLTPFHHRMSRMTRIRVNLFTQTMYTRRKYGVTYWKFGLISMMSFTKFLWLYSKMLMNVYRNNQ